MRVARQHGNRQADAFEHGGGNADCLALVGRHAVQQQRPCQDGTDSVSRIKRAHRVLKNHLHVTLARDITAGKIGKGEAVEQNTALSGWDQAEHGATESGLAGARLAHDPDDLPSLDIEIDAPQHAGGRVGGTEKGAPRCIIHHEAACFQQGMFRHGVLRRTVQFRRGMRR